eukprot:365226-Chlamydomonas_euryale.AAC.3
MLRNASWWRWYLMDRTPMPAFMLTSAGQCRARWAISCTLGNVVHVSRARGPSLAQAHACSDSPCG